MSEPEKNKNKKQDRADKRAAALRDNLKRRKSRQKELKQQEKDKN